jgi:hypothetical protein
VPGEEECFLGIAELRGVAVDLCRVAADLGDGRLARRRSRIRRRRRGWLVEDAADRRMRLWRISIAGRCRGIVISPVASPGRSSSTRSLGGRRLTGAVSAVAM